MKTKIFIFFILFISCVCFAQQNTFNKEAELQRFVERGGKVEETIPNIYKLTYSDGLQRVFNFNTAVNQNGYIEGFDSTIINVWEIDTTLYADKFKYWQKVILANSNQVRVPVEDINQNGLLEMYGRTRVTFPHGGQVDILEQDGQGIFQTVYSYDSTSLFVQGIGDINSDGTKEVYLRTSDTLSGKFYKADSLGAFPTTFDFIFYYYTTAQIYDMTFGDFDKNGVTDCAFMDWPIFIATYDSSINNFSEVVQFDVNDDASGFAVDDFDEDGKTDLVFSTGLHGIYVIEAEDTNQYSVVWNGPAPSVNPYMITSTKDIDGNGKPEFWIGGMDFTTGISSFWCYESDGDNNYMPVAGIELRYLVSLFTFYLQAADIDNDGVEELIINIGNHLLILEFKGNPNQHSYDLFYAKIGKSTQPGSLLRPSTIYDLNKDGKKDILLSMDIYPPPDLSYILVQDKITSVADNDKQIFDRFNLSQNYPNPFNPSTQISYSLAQDAFVTLKVYDMLGKKVAELVNGGQTVGVHEINFDASNLSSGIYIYRVTAMNGERILFSESNQMILLK